MQLKLADNLKRLRRQREITQEDLADFLGVSFQAVSKWERGEGYPDITILPAIANFFDVTLDELVGMNTLKKNAERDELMKKHRKLTSRGKIAEDIALLRDALKTFPNDYELMTELACFLDGFGNSDEERKKNREEAIALSERILKFCTDGEIRNNVQCNVCFTLWRNGETEKAIERAEKLPGIYKTRELTLPRFLNGSEQIECCQSTIQVLHWAYWWLTNILVHTDHYTVDEKIILLKKAIDFYIIIYEKEDYLFAHIRLADICEDIAILLLKQGNADDGLNYLEQAARHCVSFVTMPETKAYESLAVNTLVYQKTGTDFRSENNACRNLLCSITEDKDGIYTPLKKHDRMMSIVAELTKYAN